MSNPAGEDESCTIFEPDSGFITLDHSYGSWLPAEFSTAVANSVTYITGWVVRKVCKKLRCATCMECLVTSAPPSYDTSYSLLVLKNNGGLVVPSTGSVAVVMCTEKIIRQTMNIHSVKHICRLPQVLYNVKAELGHDDNYLEHGC